MNNIITNAQGAIGYIDCCQELKKASGETITPDAYNFNKNNQNKSNNVPVSKLLELKGEETMKYRNITIKRKPGRNTWWARFMKDGNKYAVYGKTQLECYEKLKKLVNEIFAIKDNNKQNKKYTLETWFDKFMNTYKINSGNIKPGTIKDDYRVFKNFGNIKDKTLTTITEVDIKNSINQCNGEREKQKAFILIKSVFKKAFTNGLIKKDPTCDLIKPKYEAPEKRAFTQDQQIKFLNQAKIYENKVHADFLSICLLQGLTRGECWGLKVNKINFNNNTLTIDECIKESDNDTGTKNKYRIRTMPLFEQSKKILENYKNKTNYIFDIKTWTLYEDLKNICKLANIPELTIHELRHTFITRCQEKSIPLYIIQNWVGHKKGSKVTTAVYTHTSPEEVKKYITLFNK